MTILKQESINIGIAYNAGLSVAKGKYLSFLESEDYFDLNMLENMYEKITAKNSDIIICQSNLIDSDIYLYEDQKFNFNLRYDLIPNIDNFS